MSSTQEDHLDSGTSASSVTSSPGVNAGKNKPLLDSAPTTPRLGVELAELFTENVVAKIWRVAVRELEKEVSHLPSQTTIKHN
jgi:hypothetical protein